MEAKNNGDPRAKNEESVKELYQNLLDKWNTNDAEGFALLFSEDGSSVGFDGSQMNGRNQISTELANIFKDHKVAQYIGIIREIRALSNSVMLLRANAGMVPPGSNIIKPDVNTIQTLIAVTQGEDFKIAMFQNTPAAFHGRPQLSEALTAELQNAWNDKQS